MTRPRILMADDHSLVLAGLRRLIEEEGDVVGTVEDGRALLEERNGCGRTLSSWTFPCPQAVRTALDEYQYKVVEAGPEKKHNKFV